MLDDHDLKNLEQSWLRAQMGLVSQEPALFGTTIAENILFGKQGSDMDQIIKAAMAANAHSFIQTLPNGYNTQVLLFLHLALCQYSPKCLFFFFFHFFLTVCCG